MKLREVVAVLESFYPPPTAQSWDRVGLVTGDLDQDISLVHLAVDPTLAVIDEARRAGADLLFTHHPLLLRGVHSVATTTAKGAAITSLIVGDVALYTAHTNADVADPGVCQDLAEVCGLHDVEPLTIEQDQPLGRVGTLSESVSLRDFARRLASRLPSTPVGVRVSGPADAPVSRVAVLGGAGDSLFEAVRRVGADVYVTADLRHHPALEAREEGRGGPPYLIDAGHWATEHLWLDRAASRLAEATGIETYVSTIRTDPWDFLVTPTDSEADA